MYLQVGAAALTAANATAESAIQLEGLLAAYLPEHEFRGRENRKIQYALLASASSRAGLEPDLLDEVIWWQTDDFWRYGLYAAVALVRASAAHAGVPIADFLSRVEGLLAKSAQ